MMGWACRINHHPPGRCSARPGTPPAGLQPMLEAGSGLSIFGAPSRAWTNRPLTSQSRLTHRSISSRAPVPRNHCVLLSQLAPTSNLMGLPGSEAHPEIIDMAMSKSAPQILVDHRQESPEPQPEEPQQQQQQQQQLPSSKRRSKPPGRLKRLFLPDEAPAELKFPSWHGSQVHFHLAELLFTREHGIAWALDDRVWGHSPRCLPDTGNSMG